MKVLLITPNFFDYPSIITNEIILMGHEVDWFDDRPSTNGFIKAIIRLNKNIIKPLINRYFKIVIKKIKNKKYDIVILISGQSLSFNEEMIIKLKEAQKQAEFVLYQWDSINNFKYIESLQKYFDRCYSFDNMDVQKNPNLRFMPLFYSRNYEEIGNQITKDFKYDICFVGTAHPKKYKFICLIIEQMKDIYRKRFIYFFFPSRLVFIYRRFKNEEFRKTHYKDFNYIPIDGKKLCQIISQSRYILDSSQDGQNGLTIRTLECLGAKRKIITTNTEIINYDFYREENIYLYTGNFDFKSKFFTEPFVPLNKEIYEKYSLRNWIDKLLNG